MSGPLTKRRLYNLKENERRLVIPPDLAHPVSLALFKSATTAVLSTLSTLLSKATRRSTDCE